jgi:hypothetical protein
MTPEQRIELLEQKINLLTQQVSLLEQRIAMGGNAQQAPMNGSNHGHYPHSHHDPRHSHKKKGMGGILGDIFD